MYLRTLLALGAAFLPMTALAAGAYVVDDADIADAGVLQNENWISHSNKGETLGVANLAYQAFKDTEIGLQYEYDALHDNHTNSLSPEVKYLWWKSADEKLRTSVVVGGEYLFDGEKVNDFYAYVPISYKVSDALDLNVNFGVEYVKDTSNDVTSWGMNGEYHFNKDVSVIGEIFGHDEDTPGFQVGPHVVFSKLYEADLIYGHNVYGHEEDVVTAGLTINW